MHCRLECKLIILENKLIALSKATYIPWDLSIPLLSISLAQYPYAGMFEHVCHRTVGGKRGLEATWRSKN